MLIFYTFLVRLVLVFIPIFSLFSKKINLFYNGRKNVISELQQKISKTDEVIWLHSASLGEYEQGLPIIKKLRELFPKKKVVVSFFSPSGYEIKKNTTEAHVVVYLPLDTPQNVADFLQVLHPEMAIFVKYEFWLNYLHTLKSRGVPTYLVSGIFREDQLFFKPYGGFMREGLACFTHFFVQNETSEKLLQSIGFKNVTHSGDTRFDRVLEILHRNNTLPFIETFKGSSPCVVLGSTWADDEKLFLPFINENANFKFIIVPHIISSQEVQALKNKIKHPTLLYSEKEGENLAHYTVFIIDTIGLLTKIYSYANLAYVGGGMATGLHNVLEPATFGTPVIIGKEFSKYQEATDLVALGGIRSVASSEEFNTYALSILQNSTLAQQMGAINAGYIAQKAGATAAFVKAIVSQ